MGATTRWLAAVLAMAVFSGAAFGQADEAYRIQVALGPWGNNVLVTAVLTKDQPFEKLFSNNLLVSDMVAQWKANFEALPVKMLKSDEIRATLDTLTQAFASNPTIRWTAQDLLVRKWADLPGDAAVKGQLRAAFATLKADGLTCLSFMLRSESEAAPEALVTAMVNILANPRLSALTHMALYTTSAEGYSDDDMSLLISAMNDVRLIRTSPPSSGQEKATASCCSRTTRKCVSSTRGCCSMCSTACCLGSTWCS